MLTVQQIYRTAAASIANLVAIKRGNRLGSGTGFLINGKLVTCAHVVRLPSDVLLQVDFEKPAPNALRNWTYANPLPFRGMSEEHSFDYAILDLPPKVAAGPSLSFGTRLPEVGEPVCALGYPFEDPHLTIHQGIVSAVFRSGPATMLKLDMSVNPSNSGGPLISMTDGAVVGVVARKATGLTQMFAQLMQSFDQNIRALQQGAGIFSAGGVDPVSALVAGQHQMKAVAVEIERSANVGIGYAIWIDSLCDEAAFAT